MKHEDTRTHSLAAPDTNYWRGRERGREEEMAMWFKGERKEFTQYIRKSLFCHIMEDREKAG